MEIIMKKLIMSLVILSLAVVLMSSTSQKADNVVKVYYFHGDFRCVTCTKMEAMIVETVNKSFANELKSNKIKFEIVNFDEKPNEHFVKDYDLFNQTLVISLTKNGKETKWKAAEKIWQLNRNEKDFSNYVRKEIHAYLKEL
jgi:NAD-dependent SIR2 family protein deacetylase